MSTKCMNHLICKQFGTICYDNHCKNCFILFSHYIQKQLVYYKPTFIENICHMCNVKDICIVMNLSKSSCKHVLCHNCFTTYIISTIPNEPRFPYTKSIENKYYNNPKLYYHDTKIIDYFNEWNIWNRAIQNKKLEYYECPLCLNDKNNNMYIIGISSIGFSVIGLGTLLYYYYWLLEYIIWGSLIYICREIMLILYY